MKHVTAYIFAAVLLLSTTAFAADTYRNATFTYNSSYAVNYSFGNIVVSATSPTVIGDPFMVQLPNGQDTVEATSGTVIGDPFSLQNPQNNSTDMNGLLAYMSSQPFLVQAPGMHISYNVMESTNNPLLSISYNYCGATGAVVELVDASNGTVLTTLNPLPSFCGISWLLNLSNSYTYNIPDAYMGKMLYVRLHVGETASYAYTSFPSSSLTNMGWSPFSGLLGKQLDNATVAGSAQLLGNYPNPVVNMTTISLQNTVGGVSLKVYDVLGRVVADLSSQVPQTSGVANIMFDASQLQNGVYFCRMQGADGVASQRELIVKK